jgi:hypothetical protein
MASQASRVEMTIRIRFVAGSLIALAGTQQLACMQPKNDAEKQPATKVSAGPDLSQLDEGGSYTIDDFLYSSVSFGRFGKRILLERRPEDMALLKAALEHTDGPRTLEAYKRLPLRRCDYALLIAEKKLGWHEEAGNTYSFGPSTPYEFRDVGRQKALRSLFGVNLEVPEGSYVYLDARGNDISDEYCQSPIWP